MRRLLKSQSNHRLITAAAEFLSTKDECIFITPAYLAGDDLAHRIGRVAGAHRLTLLQAAVDLARPAMSDLALAPLSSLGLEAIATRVTHEARIAKELGYFEPVSATPGFARALSRTLGELRLAGVSADALAASGQPGRDLALLLTRYEEELEARSLADHARIFEIASEATDHRFLKLPLLLLDVPLDFSAHRKLAAALFKQTPDILAAVTSGEDVFAELLGVPLENLDCEEPVSSLEHLRKYLFSAEPAAAAPRDGGLEIFSAPGEGLEAVEIARRILKLSLPFDNVAVLLRSPERYQPMVEEALRRARIPAYFSRGTARPDPGGRAFLALLACATEKCSASRFAEYLSLGQVPAAGLAPAREWVGPREETLPSDGTTPTEPPAIDETTIPRTPAGWERLLVDAAVIGGQERWRRRLSGLRREFELRLKTLEREDNPRRESLQRQLDQLQQLEIFALPLIDALHALPVSAVWSDWLGHLGDLARRALRHPEPVLAVLAEFEPMGEAGPATLEEVADVLSDRLRFLRNDPPKRRYGQVFVGSIEEARGREFEVVFLPGLAEGLFPQRALEDPLLLDEFRRAVGSHLPLRDDRVDRERHRLQLAVAAARTKLIASYPRMDVSEARPRVPSFYALELPRAVEGKLPELKEFERLARDAAPARLNWPAPHDAAEAIDDAEYDLVMLKRSLETNRGGRYVIDANPHLARSLRARWKRWQKKWWDADGLIVENAASLPALEAHRLNARPWSPSSLQEFAMCPYKFALHGIYGLRPREEATPLDQMDPLTRGGLFHAVQFALLGELREAKLLPVNAARLDEVLGRADQVMNRVAAEYEEDLAPAIPRVWKSEIEDLRTDLRGWLQHIAVNDDDWEPVHFEFAFGLANAEGRDPASTTEEAHLDQGVRLRGSIDLIERHTTRAGVYRVTDHKTGRPPEMIPAYVGGGRFLQPLLYGLAAERLLGSPVESGRLFYATQNGGYQHAVIPTTDKARQFLAKLLAHIDDAIAGGFLPPAPAKDACSICDYRIVCGPYEERRFAGHKDRRDERLDGLIEIRAMA